MTEKTKTKTYTIREKTKEIVSSLNIIDDTLFQKMAEDVGFCEELISTVLEQNVTVEKVIPQSNIKNLQGRSVVLDALCVLENGEKCNVEVQKANDDDHERRVRYNASCITSNIADPGIKFKNVPNVISIFISKFDIFKKKKTVYHVDRIVRETGEARDNGHQEVYVNTKVDDGSDVAKLMRIYGDQEAYDYKKFPRTSRRKKQFIKSEKGENEMCEIVENYAREVAEEAAKETAKETARNFLENGVDFQVVCKSIRNISEEELKAIYEEVLKRK